MGSTIMQVISICTYWVRRIGKGYEAKSDHRKSERECKRTKSFSRSIKIP